MKPPDRDLKSKETGDARSVEAATIRVRLLANLRVYGPSDEDEFTMKVSVRETVADFLCRIDIPAAFKPVVVVNGRPTQPTSRFSEGDRVLVYEPVTGG